MSSASRLVPKWRWWHPGGSAWELGEERPVSCGWAGVGITAWGLVSSERLGVETLAMSRWVGGADAPASFLQGSKVQNFYLPPYPPYPNSLILGLSK